MSKKLTKSAYENLKKLDPSYNVTLNVLKINVHNGLNHELSKFFSLWEILNNGNVAVTEAVFKDNKGRADVYCLDTDDAIEIINTEKGESIDIKKDKYPCNVMALKTEDILRYWLKKISR